MASVKHSITKQSTAGIRGKLDASVNADLTIPYLTHQLRVLNGRLQQEGYTEPSAARVYLFLDRLDDPDTVDVFAVGVVAPDLENDFKHHVELLTGAVAGNRNFRIVLMPGLRKIHERCP